MMKVDFSSFIKDMFIEALYKSWSDNTTLSNLNSFKISYDKRHEILSFKIIIEDQDINSYITAYANEFERIFGLDFFKSIGIEKCVINTPFLATEVYFLYSLPEKEKETLCILLKIQGYLKPMLVMPYTMFESCTTLNSINFPKNLFYNKKT